MRCRSGGTAAERACKSAELHQLSQPVKGVSGLGAREEILGQKAPFCSPLWWAQSLSPAMTNASSPQEPWDKHLLLYASVHVSASPSPKICHCY